MRVLIVDGHGCQEVHVLVLSQESLSEAEPPGPPVRPVDELQVLTPREREVLRVLAHGFDNREIAGELDISVRTVNRHLESIRDKLGTRRRSELIRIARARHAG